MNTKLLSWGILFVIIASSNAYAANGKIDFTGEIIKSTCIVSSADQDKKVNLGKYPTSAFKSKANITASKGFSITVENCEPAEYTIRFDGETVSGHPNLLAISEGEATGVGIEITTINDKLVPINQDEIDPLFIKIEGELGSKNSATFNFKAHYKSFVEEGQIGIGKANSKATFTIAYK